MTLTAGEFIRRFLLHVLPDGFKHIRSYGLLANCHRAARLATCRRLLGVVVPAEEICDVAGVITATVTSDSPESRCATAPSAAKATWSAPKASCPAHCHVHRHALTMFTDPRSHHYRSRFHSFKVATRPRLRHRVLAGCPRLGIYLTHLARITFTPPSRDSRFRFIVARRSANVCGASWMTAATIQCP